MNSSPDQEPKEYQVIKAYWQQWDNLLKERGRKEDRSQTTTYYFLIDRRDEEDSFFTYDQVTIRKLNMPIEQWKGYKPEIPRIEGEEWIEISILPKNPYRPKFAVFDDERNLHIYTEESIIYLTDQGKSLEYTRWNGMQTNLEKPSRYLKVSPKKEDLIQIFEEPEGEEDVEPIKPLKAGSIERLDFLLMKIKIGEIIDFQQNG